MLRLVANVERPRQSFVAVAMIKKPHKVSYEEANPSSSIPSPFSLPIIGNGYLLKMKHASGVPYGKQISLLHHDLTQSRTHL